MAIETSTAANNRRMRKAPCRQASPETTRRKPVAGQEIDRRRALCMTCEHATKHEGYVAVVCGLLSKDGQPCSSLYTNVILSRSGHPNKRCRWHDTEV